MKSVLKLVKSVNNNGRKPHQCDTDILNDPNIRIINIIVIYNLFPGTSREFKELSSSRDAQYGRKDLERALQPLCRQI